MANFNKAICKRRRVTIASRRASRHQHVERDSITTTAAARQRHHDDEFASAMRRLGPRRSTLGSHRLPIIPELRGRLFDEPPEC